MTHLPFYSILPAASLRPAHMAVRVCVRPILVVTLTHSPCALFAGYSPPFRVC
jgi:hypothetical protein